MRATLISLIILFSLHSTLPLYDPCRDNSPNNCNVTLCDHSRFCTWSLTKGICECPLCSSRSWCIDTFICTEGQSDEVIQYQGPGICYPGQFNISQCLCLHPRSDCSSAKNQSACVGSTCFRMIGNHQPCVWNRTTGGKGGHCFCPAGNICSQALSEYECQFTSCENGEVCVWSYDGCRCPDRLPATETTSFLSLKSVDSTLSFGSTSSTSTSSSTNSSITSTLLRLSSTTAFRPTTSDLHSTSPSLSSDVSDSQEEGSSPGINVWFISTLIGICLLVILIITAAGGIILFKRFHPKESHKDIDAEMLAARSEGQSQSGYSPMPAFSPGNVKEYAQLPEKHKLELIEAEHDIAFGELTVIEMIGEGKFGQVYRALWKNAPVACKFLKARDSTALISKEQIEEFNVEAKLHKSIPCHDNVVQFLAVCNEPEHMCIVVEYVALGSLKSKLKAEGPMSGKDTASLKIIVGIAKGMGHLHDNNLCHRDMATRNCLLTADMDVKVTDFGMTRLLVEGNPQYVTKSDMLPLRWLSPESVRDRIFTPSSDVWSYGICLCEILTAKLPYGKEMGPTEVAQKVGWEGLTPSVPQGTPSFLSHIIELCTSQQPPERPTFHQIQDLLASHL